MARINARAAGVCLLALALCGQLASACTSILFDGAALGSPYNNRVRQVPHMASPGRPGCGGRLQPAGTQSGGCLWSEGTAAIPRMHALCPCVPPPLPALLSLPFVPLAQRPDHGLWRRVW